VQFEAHLRDVTEYTRLDNPACQPHEQSVDMTQLVHGSRDALRPRAQATMA
jgi:hypothetical protein